MWITDDVNLPEKLIKSQQEGCLVVFAGAGVSMGLPSDLPDSRELALEVAAGTAQLEEDEPIDRFLGRLSERGTEVHLRASDILTRPNSRPTPLHRALVSLFCPHGAPRIVTTNFDCHFTAICVELFPGGLEVYCAPALPLGRRFAGLVYLHGSVDKNPEDMVLTDRDFGRAYLTEGWAARFLSDMFLNYTVLFVGYSHNDPDMRYLARGLPPNTSRYALMPVGQEDYWKFLGITPVPFQLRGGSGKYQAVTETIAAWVRYVQMGALDREAQVQRVVELLPPVERVTEDAMKAALTDIVTTRFFTRYARRPEWLMWAARHKSFEPLLRADGMTGEVQNELASWFAQHYVCEHPDTALVVLQGRGFLPGVLWSAIAHQLTFHKPPPDPTTLLRWVSVLLRKVPERADLSLLEYILHQCRYPEDRETILLLFEYLTRPALDLSARPGLPEESATAADQLGLPKLSVPGTGFWLHQAWLLIIAPNMQYFAMPLVPILANHLRMAHILLTAFGQGDEQYDPLTFRKDQLDARDFPDYEEGLDAVIEGSRDVIHWLVEHRPEVAAGVIAAWTDSGIPLMKRLAVSGMARYHGVNADQRIRWLLARDWLYNLPLRPEVFDLLGHAYPDASADSRNQVLERAMLGPDEEEARNLDAQTRDYEVYNLLVWLNKVAPDDPAAAKSLQRYQSEHPQFAPRDRPELNWGPIISGWVHHESPCSVDDLLQIDISEQMRWLLDFRGDPFAGPDREGLLSAMQQAGTQNHDWTWKVAEALAQQGEWDADLWTVIFQAWQKSSLTEDQWCQVVSVLNTYPKLLAHARALAGLLESAIGKKENRLPESCLTAAEEMSDRLWDAAVQQQREQPEVIGGGWLTSAINDIGGVLALFWLHALQEHTTPAREQRLDTLPVDFARRFSAAIWSPSLAGAMARVVLASQIHLLHSLDQAWTAQHIVPLLDWSINERQAEQAWDGYLTWGLFTDSLLAHLLPLYEQSFARLQTNLQEKRDRFCAHLADIALFSNRSPANDPWLDHFLLNADIESHVHWASALHRRLASLADEQRQAAWTGWIDGYWVRRNTGVPVPLSEGEKQEMIQWVLDLGPVLAAVVQRIVATRPPSMANKWFYHRLKDTEHAAKNGAHVCHLLNHLLSGESGPFHECGDIDQMVRQMAKADAPKLELVMLCNKVAELGCPTADGLRQFVMRDASPGEIQSP